MLLLHVPKTGKKVMNAMLYNCARDEREGDKSSERNRVESDERTRRGGKGRIVA